MKTRQEELCKLHQFVGNVDTELTLLLQHLQWDTKQLLESKSLVCCKYDNNHKIPEEMLKKHEKQCLLSCNGYLTEDVKLPDPLDENANTLIKFDKTEITHIISAAANIDPLFKKGSSSTQETVGDMEPLSLARLQATYTPDERRAIHDAVVKAAPFCHDLSDLALPSSEHGESNTGSKQKSRVEILAELRNMKRRRTKYRVAAKTRNYSDVLRDFIKTQMEVYSDIQVEGNINPISAHVKHTPENKTDDSKSQSQRYFRNDHNRPTEDCHSIENIHKKYNKDRHSLKNETFSEYKYSSLQLRKKCDSEKNPEPEQRDYGQRKRKKDRFCEDRCSSYKRSKTHKLSEDENTKCKKYGEMKCKEKGRSEDRSSSYKRKEYDIKHDTDSGYKDHGDRKYYRQERNSHSSRHKSSLESSKYKSYNHEVKHRKDIKNYERESSNYSEKGKYRTEKHKSSHTSSRSDREDKHVYNRYYDDQ